MMRKAPLQFEGLFFKINPMSIFQQLHDNLDNMHGDMEQIAKEIVKDNVKYILDLNRANLRKGLDAYGKHISRRYASKTESYWRKVDPPRFPNYKITKNYFDFYWSGETQDKMYITFDNQYEFSIFSAAGKATYLSSFYRGYYDFEMFGLNPQQNKHINEDIILPNLHKYILENLVKL